MSQERIAELRELIKPLRDELNELTDREDAERRAAMVGKCYRDTNESGGDVYWFVTASGDTRHPDAIKVSVSDDYCGVEKAKLWHKSTEITREEFRTVWIEMRDRLRRFEAGFTS